MGNILKVTFLLVSSGEPPEGCRLVDVSVIDANHTEKCQEETVQSSVLSPRCSVPTTEEHNNNNPSCD